MPRFKVRVELETEAEDRDEAVEIVETFIHYGLKDFPLYSKTTGTEEIR